jgi:hypothetical protein
MAENHQDEGGAQPELKPLDYRERRLLAELLALVPDSSSLMRRLAKTTTLRYKPARIHAMVLKISTKLKALLNLPTLPQGSDTQSDTPSSES